LESRLDERQLIAFTLFGLLENLYVDDHMPPPYRCMVQPAQDGDGRNMARVEALLKKYNIKYKVNNGAISMFREGPAVSFIFESGQNPVIDDVMRALFAESEVFRERNNYMLRLDKYDENAERKRGQAEVEQKDALEQLKKMLRNLEPEMYSSDDSRKYYYFYFDDKDLDRAQELFEKLGMYVDVHQSKFHDVPATVLRYPATMVPGYAADVIKELAAVWRSRRLADDARGDREAFEQGNYAVHTERGKEELKSLITAIHAISYGKNTPASHYYIVARDLERVRDLLVQFGLFELEEYDSRKLGTTVLRVPIISLSEGAVKLIKELKENISVPSMPRQNDMGGIAM